LRRAEGEVGPQLKREIGVAVEYVRALAKRNAPHRSGALERSVRKSVTQKGGSVYSNLPYAYVLDSGGRVGRNHATLLRRGDMSHYMTRAAHDGRPYVSHRVEGMLNRLGRDFDL
jgi:hypothetical protein